MAGGRSGLKQVSECARWDEWSLTHAFGLLTFDVGRPVAQPRGAAPAEEKMKVRARWYVPRGGCWGNLGTLVPAQFSQPLGVVALQKHVAVRGKEVVLGKRAGGPKEVEILVTSDQTTFSSP